MPIVTVSRQYGSGGSEVAERVANALGWKLYDNAVVEEVAARLRLTPAEVSAREERVPSLVERMASAMALGVPEVMPVVGDMAAVPSEERMVMVTKRVIEDAVEAGPAVLVGRGAQCMLARRSDALHVYCYAAEEDLIRYVIEKLDIPRKQVAGLSVWQHGLRTAFLNVSAGLGTSIYAPVRFACPPEATLLTRVPSE